MTGDIQPINSRLRRPKKGMPEWGPGYLEALHECRGRALDAAKAMGMDHSTVYKAHQNYPELDKAYQDVKALWDDIVLEGLQNQAHRGEEGGRDGEVGIRSPSDLFPTAVGGFEGIQGDGADSLNRCGVHIGSV